jgi:limonene-1,2-epoxide hydrolase
VSHARAERVRSLVERWNSGDRSTATLRAYFHPTVEMQSPLAAVSGEAYRGYAGLERWMRDLDDQFAEWRMSADDVREVGKQVIAIATIDARGRASDVPLRFPSAGVFGFDSDDRVTQVRIYADVNEGLKAVGLEE